jgi:hypothetical protein
MFMATVDGPRDPVTTSRVPVSVVLDVDNNVTGAVVDLEPE